MTVKPAPKVRLGFEPASLRLPLDAIYPLHEISAAIRKSVKYAQIAASVAEIGLVEPPVVARDASDRDRYHLLDGHLRVDILRNAGAVDVVCLIAIEDEAFTYNRRISRIAIIQEHKMILNAVKKGVSEERLARALNVNIGSIRAKQTLLRGICPEVVELLRDRHVPINTFHELRYLKSIRQIAVTQLMISMNRFSSNYAKSLVAATPADQLCEGRTRRKTGLSDDQAALIQRESENLEREFRVVEANYGADHLDMVLATGYIARLLENVRVVRYLAQHHADIFTEFQKIADYQKPP